jgi:hypothetical protein
MHAAALFAQVRQIHADSCFVEGFGAIQQVLRPAFDAFFAHKALRGRDAVWLTLN